MSKNRRLVRFGILCNGTTFPAWQASCLEKILDLEYVEAGLIILNNNSSTASKGLKNLKKKKNLNKLLWNIYFFFFLKRASQAIRPRAMTSTLAGIPRIYCKLIQKGRSLQHFCEADITEIRRYDLDFILHFGSGIIRGEILKVPRFGVWSFHQEDKENYPRGLSCFWEIYRDDKITGAILKRLTDQLDKDIILKKGFFKTIHTSHARNLDAVCFECTEWPAQVCNDIHNGTVDYFDAGPSQTQASIPHAPNNIQIMFFLLKIIKNILLKLCDSLFFYKQWNIGIADKPIHTFLASPIKRAVRWLPAPPWNKLISDPFAIRQGKTVHMLFEDYEYRTSKGTISTMSISRKSLSTPQTVIESPFHMSYPYLLEYKNQIYCVPETHEAQEVSLYKAKEFPYSWEKAAVLIKDFAGADSTVFQYNGLWWLLATDYNDSPYHKLKVWHAPNLFGPWKPHVKNPVKVDIRSARPGGTPFLYDGDLYRPSQDCSEVYGGRIVLNRVTRLTPTEFKEEQIAFIEPNKNGPYPKGLHTISKVGEITLIDGARKVFIFRNLSMLLYNLSELYNKMMKMKQNNKNHK